ncbi:MAG: HAMP domain-containing protein [Alphaproteobacteria bacterium]|nr:HAMP domain-containing protein [Alphaproteobacteria bacterium]
MTEPTRNWLEKIVAWATRTSVLATIVTGLCVMALVSSLVLSGATPWSPTRQQIPVLIVINSALVLLAAVLLVGILVRVWIARRSGSAGARLHGRLVMIFGVIAIVPAVLIAITAIINTNLIIANWFSSAVRSTLDNSIGIADSYIEEQTQGFRANVLTFSGDVNLKMGPLMLEGNPLQFHAFLEQYAAARSLEGVAIFDKNQTSTPIDSATPAIVATIDPPTPQELVRADSGELVVSTDTSDSQIRAVTKLEAFSNKYLVAVRSLNAKVLAYQQDTKNVVAKYRNLEDQNLGFQTNLALTYVLVALAILIAATVIGLWLANRIVTPIGRLIGASERVSEGDLTARVQLDSGDDELASLGRAFNRMTGELQSQRNELIESNRQAEQRRRFTEAVLSGVSAGVVGMDGHGRVDIVNRSALTLVGAQRDDLVGHALGAAVPELQQLLDLAMQNPEGRAAGQVDITRQGNTRNLTVRVTRERASEHDPGFVVTFDDITDLIAAQRTSAWADVARRIAHEIKNPLTPIQLSAERLRRKYKKEIETDPEVFEQCTQTIIRQVGDIGRMVDEFSSFARMPQPVMREEDICELIRHSVFLQRVANPQITYALLVPDQPVSIDCDGRLVSQAMTNVLKNAGEAVRSVFGIEGADGDAMQDGGRIEVRMRELGDSVAIEVIDNGVGLPPEDRNRLTEPYVTKRAKGTGLGLAIVKKIMEDHHGSVTLEDAPDIDETGASRSSGALVRLTFPRHTAAGQTPGDRHEQERRAVSA